MIVKTDRNKTFANVYFPSLVGLSCVLPLCALFFCETYSILVTFEVSTSTECGNPNVKVWNFLPSISEAVGRSSPQSYVWRICIALIATPHLLIATAYYKMHSFIFQGKGTTVSLYQNLTLAAFLLHVTETLSLVGLSFVSSTENYGFHKFCFVIFMLTATIHMTIMCIVFKYGRKAAKLALTHKEQRSATLKLVLFVANITAFLFALYFFYRHNNYCEHGVYSFFGLFEIIVIVTNIAFHGTAMIDFSTTNVVLQDMDR